MLQEQREATKGAVVNFRSLKVQAWAVFAMRLQLARNDWLGTAGMLAPPSIAYFVGCLVVGEMQELDDEGRAAVSVEGARVAVVGEGR